MKNDTPNNLQRYFSEMGKFPVLTPAEEMECAQNIVKHFDKLVDEMLAAPFVWQHVFTSWQRIKADGRASNKLAEEYGNPKHNAEDLTLQVDANVEAAINLARSSANPEIIADRVAYHLKSAGLSKHIILDLVDETLAQPILNDDMRGRISDARDGVVKYRHQLVNANLRLVINFAKKFNGYGIPLEDLIQEGNIGLMRAAEKFDPSRNLKFSTYAAWWIRQSFIKALKKQGKTIRLPSHIHDAMSKLKKAHEELFGVLRREPSLEELGERVEMAVDLVEKLMALKSEPLSLETPISFSSNRSDNRPKYLKDFIEDDSIDPNGDIDLSRREEALIGAIKTHLTKYEGRIILLRFGLDGNDPHTLEQIADRLNKSRERIRQVETNAVKKLRQHAQYLEEFNNE